MGLKRRPSGRASDAQVSPHGPGMSVGPLGASQWVQGSSPTPYSWFPVAHASGEALHLIVSLLSLLCGVVRSQSTAQAGAYVDPLPGGGLSLQQPPAMHWLLHQPGKQPALLQLTKSRTSTLLSVPVSFLH